MTGSGDAPSAIPAYERDPYRRELAVEILALGRENERPYVVLDDTILYPEGGGQPCDGGRLGAVPVVAVRRVGGEIRHYLQEAVEPGRARLRLDWPRRYDHMQQHTAQHLLTATALARRGWATTAFHLGAEVSSIDLDIAPPRRQELDALEEAVVEEIATGRPVLARRVNRAEFERLVAAGRVRSRRLPAGHRGAIRLVEIEDLDCNTCGGTHLASLAEIATFKVLGVEPARGGCRLLWVAGDRLRKRLGRLEMRSEELRRLFETSAEEISEVARRKLDQLRAAQRRLRDLEDRWAEAAAAELASRRGTAEAHFDDVDGGFLQRVARAFSPRAGDRLALLTASGDQGDFFALAAGRDCTVDLKALGGRIAEVLEGRGGGAGQLFQGKAGTLERRSEAVAALEPGSGK